MNLKYKFKDTTLLELAMTQSGINIAHNNERLETLIEINRDSADGYISIYFAEDTTNTLKTYENWWTDIQNIVSKILLQGENK